MKITKAQLKRLIKEELGRILSERSVDPGDALGTALKRQLVNNKAYTAETAMDVDTLMNSDRGTLWAEIQQMGVDPGDIKDLMRNKRQYYTGQTTSARTLDGKGFEWEVTGDAQNSKIFWNPRS
tara:strand:+ start:354 stop:725 length:372 start_codon:yes stop_codon:yes gene_type:complete